MFLLITGYHSHSNMIGLEDVLLMTRECFKWRVIILVTTVVDGEATQFVSWKIKEFTLTRGFQRKSISELNPFCYVLAWRLEGEPSHLGKPWAAHECDLRQVLQDGISVGYLQLGLRLFHSNPKSSNKITVMDWMLHRTDALLIHVFYIYFQSKRTPSKWNFGLATAEVGGRLEISDQHVQMRFSPMPVLASSVCSVGIAILFSGIQAWQN